MPNVAFLANMPAHGTELPPNPSLGPWAPMPKWVSERRLPSIEVFRALGRVGPIAPKGGPEHRASGAGPLSGSPREPKILTPRVACLAAPFGVGVVAPLRVSMPCGAGRRDARPRTCEAGCAIGRAGLLVCVCVCVLERTRPHAFVGRHIMGDGPARRKGALHMPWMLRGVARGCLGIASLSYPEGGMAPQPGACVHSCVFCLRWALRRRTRKRADAPKLRTAATIAAMRVEAVVESRGVSDSVGATGPGIEGRRPSFGGGGACGCSARFFETFDGGGCCIQTSRRCGAFAQYRLVGVGSAVAPV